MKLSFAIIFISIILISSRFELNLRNSVLRKLYSSYSLTPIILFNFQFISFILYSFKNSFLLLKFVFNWMCWYLCSLFFSLCSQFILIFIAGLTLQSLSLTCVCFLLRKCARIWELVRVFVFSLSTNKYIFFS